MKYFDYIRCIQQATTSGTESFLDGFFSKRKDGLSLPVLLLSLGFGLFLIYNHPTIINTPKTIDTSTTGTTIAITFVSSSFVLTGVNDVVVLVFRVVVVVAVTGVGDTMQHFPVYPQNFSWSGLNVLLQYLRHHSQPKRPLQSSAFLKQKN